MSTERETHRGDALYWFGLKRKTKEQLEKERQPYCAFGLGNPQRVLMLPFSLLAKHLTTFFSSPEPDGSVLHWHVRFLRTADRIELLINRDRDKVDVTQYLVV